MSQERAVAIYAYQADPTIVHFDEHWHAARKRNEPMSLPVDWDVVAVVQGELALDGLIINGGEEQPSRLWRCWPKTFLGANVPRYFGSRKNIGVGPLQDTDPRRLSV